MKKQSRQKQFNRDGGNSEHEICQQAGSQHICGSNRGDVETSQDSLLAEHHESGTESPEAAHHVKGNNRPEKKADGARIATRENPGIEKKHGQWKDDAEKEK